MKWHKIKHVKGVTRKPVMHKGSPVTRDVARVSVADVLARLRKTRKTKDGWMACCPAHPDTTPSLSVGIGDDGRILLNCFAGCSPYRLRKPLATSGGT